MSNDNQIDSREDELLPCPFCGHKPLKNNLIDSLHKTGIYLHFDKVNDIYHYTSNPECAVAALWQMGCLENEGGCGARVSGEGKEGAIGAWNRRPTQVPEVEAEPEWYALEIYGGANEIQLFKALDEAKQWKKEYESQGYELSITELFTQPQPQAYAAKAKLISLQPDWPTVNMSAAGMRVIQGIKESSFHKHAGGIANSVFAAMMAEAPQPQACKVPEDLEPPEPFKHYIRLNMPAGTVIGDPEWWIKRLWRAVAAAADSGEVKP